MIEEYLKSNKIKVIDEVSEECQSVKILKNKLIIDARSDGEASNYVSRSQY